MINNKVYTILQYFDVYEINKLRKYINSPYFNKSDALIALFELMIKSIEKDKKNQGIDRKKVWSKLIPDKAFDDVRFRKYCSDLLKLVEGFMAQQIYEENPLHQAPYLLQAVGNKKVEKLYASALKTARRDNEKQNFKSAEYFYYQYLIEKKDYQIKHLIGWERIKRFNMEEIVDNLDYFYLAEKLRYYCTVLSQQTVISHEYKVLFIEDIINHIELFLEDYQKIPPIAVYYQVYLTLIDSEKTENYYNLKKILDKYGHIFPRIEAKGIYDNAINYCIRKNNEGQREFIDELFSLYKELLDKEIIDSGGELAPWHFNNIVTVGTRLGEYEWTENFIKSYQFKLPDSFRENAVSYTLARVYFFRKQYSEVIKLLAMVEYEDFSYNLNSKAILLATYYETNETEPLYSLMEAFRVYLNRHKKIPADRRKWYSNLIKFTKKLINIAPGDKEAVKKLKAEVDATKGIASENWLREKIEELEKK